MFFETFGKIRRRREPHFVSHLSNGFTPLQKKWFGTFQSSDTNKFHWGNIGQCFHLAIELHAAHSHFCTQVFHCECSIGKLFSNLRFEILDELTIHIEGWSRGWFGDVGKKIAKFLTVDEEIFDTWEKHFTVKWFGDIGIGSTVVAFSAVIVKGVCSEQNHGNVRRNLMVFETTTKFQSSQNGHRNITNNEVGHLTQCQIPSLLSVGGCEHFVVRFAQKLRNVVANRSVVIYHQHIGWSLSLLI